MFNYDVFISYSSRDKARVRRLAQRLRADGLHVWFDEWTIRPGDMIGMKIEEGLEQSRTLILAMSVNAMVSEWVKLERHAVLFRDPTNSGRRFIPLRLDEVEIPITLKQFAHVDWREESNDEYLRLLAVCRSPLIPPVEEQSNRPTRVLTAHKKSVWSVAISADGKLCVSASRNKTLRVWNAESGATLATLLGHKKKVSCVAISPDGSRAVSGSDDQTVRIWDLENFKNILILSGHNEGVRSVCITADGLRALSTASDGNIKVWDLKTGTCIATLTGHTAAVQSIAITPDGRRSVSGSVDCTLRQWDLNSFECDGVLEGHKQSISSVAISADGKKAFSGSADGTLRVWDLEALSCVAAFEGHTEPVLAVALTPDGRRAVSGSQDKSVRVWKVTTGECIAVLADHTNAVWGVAISADGRRTVSGSHDRTLRIWDLPTDEEYQPQVSITRYTNAKILLVGDSGVGKTGLALRLAEGHFEPTISSDAVWATQLRLPEIKHDVDLEREIWLWDFAGQADYRLIHQLYMDETAVAVLVFNPQSDNPFDGLGQWDRDLKRAARRPFKKLLVAGRCDRGGLVISRERIEAFRRERSFDKYLETSAYTGKGCDELRNEIVSAIDWHSIPWTASPQTFKLLKQEIIKLKDEGKVLLRIAELKQQLEMRLPAETFATSELHAVIGLLAGPGVVWKLEFGDFVLLQPERINEYASAVIRTVRAHTDEIGCIEEERLLSGDLDYQDVNRLTVDEEQIVLRAMHQTFVDHKLCMRENSDIGTLLVFPSYFKRERPDLAEHPSVFITYRFNGPLDEIYATLIVKLHHTSAFETDTLWRFAADFRTPSGLRVGVKMINRHEGAAELTVYFEPGVPDDTKVMFIRYVHDHLKSKDPNVVRIRHYVCPQTDCGEPVESIRAVQRALERGETDIPCQFCRQPVPLMDLIEQKFNSSEFERRVRELDQGSADSIENESTGLILVGHAMAIANEAGQIFRTATNSEWGIDGEIEFRNTFGEASGQKILLQFKSGDSYSHRRRVDGREVFTVRSSRYLRYWRAQRYPVMLIIRMSDGPIRWMNITEYLVSSSEGKVSNLFTADDLIDVGSFLDRLRLSDDPLSRYVVSSFDKYLQQIVQAPSKRDWSIEVKKSLATQLNSLLQDGSMIENAQLQTIAAKSTARRVVRGELTLDELIAFNRSILEQAYPSEFLEQQNRQIVFEGTPFTASGLLQMRDEFIRSRLLN